MDREEEARDLIEQMREAAKKNLDVSISLRTENPESSRFFWKMADVLLSAAADLEAKQPKEMEIEGGGTRWWYVCPECHGAIDIQDHFCRHCGQAVKG